MASGLLDELHELVEARLRLQRLGRVPSADAVCDAILGTKPSDQTRDDIALVVVRLTAPAGKAPPLSARGAPAHPQALHNPSMSRR